MEPFWSSSFRKRLVPQKSRVGPRNRPAHFELALDLVSFEAPVDQRPALSNLAERRHRCQALLQWSWQVCLFFSCFGSGLLILVGGGAKTELVLQPCQGLLVMTDPATVSGFQRAMRPSGRATWNLPAGSLFAENFRTPGPLRMGGELLNETYFQLLESFKRNLWLLTFFNLFQGLNQMEAYLFLFAEKMLS